MELKTYLCIIVFGESNSKLKKIYDQVKAPIIHCDCDIADWSIDDLKSRTKIKDDISLISLSGMLWHMNWSNGFKIEKDFFIPSNLRIFCVVSLGLFVLCITNIIKLNKIYEGNTKNKHYSKIEYSSMSGLIYMMQALFAFLSKTQLEKTESLGLFEKFPKNRYNYFVSKDGGFIANGNLEDKFNEDTNSFFRRLHNSTEKEYTYDDLASYCKSISIEKATLQLVSDKNCVSKVMNMSDAMLILQSYSGSTFISQQDPNYNEIVELSKFLFNSNQNLVDIRGVMLRPKF